MSEEVEVVEPTATAENVETPVGETQAPQEVKTEAETKSFTQAELDAIIQKEKAKAEAKAERRALKAYRETLERLAPQQQPKQQEQPGRPSRESFANDEDWVEAVADWKLEQREQVTRQQKESARAKSLVEKTESIYAEASKIPEFDRDAFDELPLTRPVAEAIIESEVSAKVMAYLSTNPDEVTRIIALPPARQAAEIGKIEVKVTTVPKVSKAPNPITPLGAVKGGSKDPSEMTDKEFNEWRRRQIAQRK